MHFRTAWSIFAGSISNSKPTHSQFCFDLVRVSSRFFYSDYFREISVTRSHRTTDRNSSETQFQNAPCHIILPVKIRPSQHISVLLVSSWNSIERSVVRRHHTLPHVVNFNQHCTMEFDESIDEAINMSATLFDDGDDEVIIGLMATGIFKLHLIVINKLIVPLSIPEQPSGVVRGSQPGRSPNINRNFRKGHQGLMDDYFNDNSTYDEKFFLRQFRMQKTMFLRIMSDLEAHDDFFKLRCDAAGKLGLSPVQKCTAALRMLSRGAAAGDLDEYVRIGESTALLTLRKFCTGVIEVYGPEYLRPPTTQEVQKLLEENAKRGFPGMVASIDCMHWTWKNCPVALHGQYQGKEGKPTVVLEACASQDTYVWHCFFGCPGSCNDINILDRSPLINDIVQVNFNMVYVEQHVAASIADFIPNCVFAY